MTSASCVTGYHAQGAQILYNVLLTSISQGTCVGRVTWRWWCSVSPVQLDTANALQAREGIAAADISMGLLHAQSQMGLSSQGPLSARALAEAALQVNCAIPPCLSLCLCLSAAHACGPSMICSQPLTGERSWIARLVTATTRWSCCAGVPGGQQHGRVSAGLPRRTHVSSRSHPPGLQDSRPRWAAAEWDCQVCPSPVFGHMNQR